MKKAFMLVAAIALLAAPVFAAEFSVTGNVSATFGVDLNNGATGFENAADIDIVVPFIEAESSESIEGEGMYGEITVSDFSVGIIDGSLSDLNDGDDSMSGTITGKVHFGDVFVGIYNTPDVDKNYADNSFDVDDAGLVQGDMNSDTAWLGATGGMSVGFDNGDQVVELSIASVNDWDDDSAAGKAAVTKNWMTDGQTAKAAVAANPVNTDNKYIVALTTDLAFGGFGFEGAFWFANKFWADKAYIGFGAKPSYELDFSEAMGLEVAVGLDGVVLPVEALGATFDGLYMDLAPMVTFNMTAENEDGDRSYVELGAYMQFFTATAFDATNQLMNLSAKFEEVQDGGFVDGLGATIEFGIYDLLDANVTANKDLYALYSLDIAVDYEIMSGLDVSADFGMGTDDHKINLGVGVEAGSDLHGIANTTFSADYATSSLVENTTYAVAQDKGVVTFKTKISF